ncbi:MAG: O-antigen ligase family protein [Peptococcaceae bacterium]|nr:O-antigen ligase family protein [Peptococcaceae bacterium]
MAKRKSKRKTKDTTAPARTTTPAASRPLIWEIAFWGLAALLFFSPYFRGLFFPSEQYKFLVLAAVVFWLVWLGKWALRQNKFFEHPLDYLVFGLPVVYLYSAFFAVNTGDAVNEVIKYTLYFLAFWSAARLLTGRKDINTMFKVIYGAAIVVSLAGLATATGIVYIKDGFLNGRIYSSFQYPNALASYLMAVFFIGLYLWQDAVIKGKKSFYPYLYAAGNFIIFTVFLGTQSNGGTLVFLLMLPLFITGVAKEWRIPHIWHFVLVALPSALAINRFLAAVAAEKFNAAWGWVFIGLLLAAAGQALFDLWDRRGLSAKLGGYRRIITWGSFGAFGATILGALVYAFTNPALQGKIQGLVKMRSAVTRLDFIGDALEMMTARPLTGWGGGGWQEAYQAFLNYNFISRQVHSHYAQVGVETGIIGVALFAVIWAVFLWTGHKLYHGSKGQPERRTLVWVTTVAALGIGLHAAIDFDLSLSALTLVLFTLMGVMAGLARQAGAAAEAGAAHSRGKYVPPDNLRLVAVSAVTVLIIAAGVCFSLASSYAVQGAARFNKGDFKGGLELLHKAQTCNPFKADYHTALAQAYKARGELDKALEQAELAVSKSKYDPARYQMLATVYYAKEDYEASVQNAEKAVSVAPLKRQVYEFLTEACFLAGQGALEKGEKDAARGYLEKALNVPERMQQIMAGLSEDEKKLWQNPKLVPSRKMQLHLGASHYLMGNFDAAVENMENAAKDKDLKPEALMWLSLAREQQGKTQEAEKLLNEAKKLNPNITAKYDQAKQLPVLSQ